MNSQGIVDGPVALTKFAWNTFMKHWKILGSIFIVPVVFYAVGTGLVLTHSSIGSILGFVAIIAAYVFIFAAVPATIQTIHRLSVDPASPISLKAQYRFGFSIFWSFVLVSIIAGFAGTGSILLLVIPGIFVIIATTVYKYTLVIDGKKGFSALTESFALVRGRWWKVFGRVLFLALIFVAIYIVIFIVTLILGFLPDILAMVLGTIFGLVLVGFVWSFVHAYFYRLYISLKESRSADVPTATFKSWLIAFLCIGVVMPFAIIPVASSIILVSLNQARLKALDAQQNSQVRMAEIQRMVDAESLQVMQGTGTPMQK